MEKFGTYSEAKKTYALPKETASLMNSLPLLGKFLGTVIIGPIIERIGHRYAMTVTCLVQVVGAISKCSSSGIHYVLVVLKNIQSRSRATRLRSSCAGVSLCILLSA